MKLSHFFIDRPIFAIVISVVTVVLGCIAFVLLPVTQFPEIAPPTIVVTERRSAAVETVHSAPPVPRITAV